MLAVWCSDKTSPPDGFVIKIRAVKPRREVFLFAVFCLVSNHYGTKNRAKTGQNGTIHLIYKAQTALNFGSR
jgi:hypothetical protein